MKINLKEMSTFSLLAAIMLVSKLLLEAIPNFHLLAVFTIAITVVYRQKALYPIYLYVFLQGLVAGFNPWWVIHIYVWLPLWGIVMILPKNLSKGKSAIMYSAVATLHGLFFGILSAISQAPVFGLGFIEMIITGIPYDLIHAGHNLILSAVLIMPIIKVLIYAKKHTDS